MMEDAEKPAEKISIHVLREEDDLISSAVPWTRLISIHVLREEDDYILLTSTLPFCKFQSPSSARRTTYILLCGYLGELISIHVLREEDDVLYGIRINQSENFNPRPPRGGRLV